MSVCSQPSITITESALPMAKEFTSDIVERKNLAYVTHGGPSQTLDLYALKKGKEVPLIVWIHGGFGSKEGFPVEPVPLHLLLEGYCGSVDQLSPEPRSGVSRAIRGLQSGRPLAAGACR